jgi:DNA polymerase III subunit beta
MKFTIEQHALATALGRVAPIANGKQVVPILGHALFDAGEGLEITTTNLDIWATARIGAEVEKAGSETVNASSLLSIIKGFPKAADISLDFADGFCVIKAGRSRYKLPTLPVSDFPIPKYPDGASFECADLIPAIMAVKHAMATEETKFSMMGVHLKSVDNSIDVIATDGQRGSSVFIAEGSDGIDAIVPTGMISSLDSFDNPKFTFTADKVMIESASLTIISKLVDATFPPVRKVIDRCLDNPHQVIVTSETLLSAISRILQISDEKYRRMKIDLSPGRMVITSANSGAEGQEELPCAYEGEEFSISVNGVFLRDAVSNLGTDEVELKLSSEAPSPTQSVANLIKGRAGCVNLMAGVRA